jgi:signal transduction histidine kinase
MHAPNFAETLDHLASRLVAEHTALAAGWLERLEELLSVDARDVFPGHQLLDHIPQILSEIAAYLRLPAHEEIAVNTAVMAKATELGLLRFDQDASVHQLLREYQFLSEILEQFFARETAAMGSRADATAAVLALSRCQQAVRELQRKTVDAFLARYTETIERQHERLRGFGRLVSHEIRQPLGVLQVLAHLFPDAADPAVAHLVDMLQRNVVQLSDVSAKLERLARLTRWEEHAPNDQRIDLVSVSRDVARQLSDMADVRGVRFEIADDLPALMADAGRVELVLANLLANAVKYSDPGKAERVVRMRGAVERGRPVVYIEDNGLGIPVLQRERIFNQFVRAHAHLDDELGAQGLGLGLAIVRESMEAMDGTVTVQSMEGQGATFTLTWPSMARHGEGMNS